MKNFIKSCFKLKIPFSLKTFVLFFLICLTVSVRVFAQPACATLERLTTTTGYFFSDNNVAQTVTQAVTSGNLYGNGAIITIAVSASDAGPRSASNGASLSISYGGVVYCTIVNPPSPDSDPEIATVTYSNSATGLGGITSKTIPATAPGTAIYDTLTIILPTSIPNNDNLALNFDATGGQNDDFTVKSVSFKACPPVQPSCATSQRLQKTDFFDFGAPGNDVIAINGLSQYGWIGSGTAGSTLGGNTNGTFFAADNDAVQTLTQPITSANYNGNGAVVSIGISASDVGPRSSSNGASFSISYGGVVYCTIVNPPSPDSDPELATVTYSNAATGPGGITSRTIAVTGPGIATFDTLTIMLPTSIPNNGNLALTFDARGGGNDDFTIQFASFKACPAPASCATSERLQKTDFFDFGAAGNDVVAVNGVNQYGWTGTGTAGSTFNGNTGNTFFSDNATQTLTQTVTSANLYGNGAVVAINISASDANPRSGSNGASFSISYGGVVYCTITNPVSPDTDPETATVTYSNFATGPGGITSTTMPVTAPGVTSYTTITIILPSSIPNGGDLALTFDASGTQNDDFAVQSVSFKACPFVQPACATSERITGSTNYFFSQNNTSETITMPVTSANLYGNGAIINIDVSASDAGPRSGSNGATFNISYGGVVYCSIVNPPSPDSDPEFATITYSNFATGPGGITSTTMPVTAPGIATFTTLTIILPTPIPNNGNLTLTLDATGGGNDDVTVQSVSYKACPLQPQPFPCSNGVAYQISGSPSALYTVNVNTGTKTLLFSATTLGNISLTGLGYNIVDNYLYASVAGTNNVARIDNNGTVTIFPITGLPASSYTAGDVSPSGVLYLYLSNATNMQRVDLASMTLLPAITVNGGFQLTDISVSNDGNNIYGLAAGTGNLINLPIGGGTATITSNAGLGAISTSAFTEVSGKLILIDNANSRSYVINNPASPTPAIQLSPNLNTAISSTDGASCRLAVLTVVSLTGTVFIDPNNNTVIDAGEYGSSIGTNLYVYLVNSAGFIEDSSLVAADGTYALIATPGSSYTIQLSTMQYAIGADTGVTPISTALPAGWINTGENGAGNTGNGDGIPNSSLPVTVGTTNVTQQNFGIKNNLQPFPCTNLAYQVVAPAAGSNSTLYSYDVNTGTRTTIAALTAEVNSIGYNEIDNTIWGYDRTNLRLIQIGADGTSAFYNIPNLPGSASYNVGAVLSGGYLFIYQSTQAKYYVVDINSSRSTYLNLVDPLIGYAADLAPYGTTASSTFDVSDMAYSPATGLLYGVGSPGSANQFKIISLNPLTGNVSVSVTAQGANIQSEGTAFGSIFTDANGKFIYAFSNTLGRFYRIDLSSGQTTLLSQSITSNNNDGASCPLAIFTVNITGKVFNDANANTLIDGSDAGTTAGTNLYVYLINSAGIIEDSSRVASDGTYSLSATQNTNYRVELSTVQYATGTNTTITPVNHALPSGWVTTGENGAGNTGSGDGTPDGSLAVTVGTTNVTQQNFGIRNTPQPTCATSERLSGSTTYSFSQNNTSETATLPVTSANLYGNGAVVTIDVSASDAGPRNTSNGATFNISYGGIIYCSIVNPPSPDSDPEFATITYSNSATGPGGITSTTMPVTAPGVTTFTTLTIILPTPIPNNGDITLTLDATGGGNDDITVQSVSFKACPALTACATSERLQKTDFFDFGAAGNDVIAINGLSQYGWTGSGTAGSTLGGYTNGTFFAADNGAIQTFTQPVTSANLYSNGAIVSIAISASDVGPRSNSNGASFNISYGGVVYCTITNPAAPDSDPEDATVTYSNSATGPGGITSTTMPVTGPGIASFTTLTIILPTSIPNTGDLALNFSTPGTGNDDFTVQSVSFKACPAVVVPVKLVSFAGTAGDCKTALTWQTGAGVNFNHFEVEVSTDGRAYTKIGEVSPSQATGDHKYTYSYSRPAAVGYYRLKLIDGDGSSSYSAVVVVKSTCPDAPVIIYPNPATDYAMVDGLKSGSTIRLVSVTGEVMEVINYRGGQLKLKLSQYPAGVYYLNVTNNNLSNVYKIVVSR